MSVLPLLCRNFYSDLFELLRAVTRLRDVSNELREYSKEVNEVHLVHDRASWAVGGGGTQILL